MCGGAVAPLTGTERAIMVMLFRTPGAVVSYENLCRVVWGIDEPDRALLRQHLKRVKAKVVGKLGAPWPVRAVRGTGYLWDPTASG